MTHEVVLTGDHFINGDEAYVEGVQRICPGDRLPLGGKRPTGSQQLPCRSAGQSTGHSGAPASGIGSAGEDVAAPGRYCPRRLIEPLFCRDAVVLRAAT